MESVSHKLCSSASESVAVGQVILYRAFSPYAGGGHVVELPFYVVPEINASKWGYGCVMLGTFMQESVYSCVG